MNYHILLGITYFDSGGFCTVSQPLSLQSAELIHGPELFFTKALSVCCQKYLNQSPKDSTFIKLCRGKIYKICLKPVEQQTSSFLPQCSQVLLTTEPTWLVHRSG